MSRKGPLRDSEEADAIDASGAKRHAGLLAIASAIRLHADAIVASANCLTPAMADLATAVREIRDTLRDGT